MKDVIIIGAGPAGYTAAIYTSRARLETQVIAGVQAGGQLMWTTEVENFPGFREGIMGPELVSSMAAQAARFGAEFKQADVSRIDFSGPIKKIWVGDEVLEAKAVIITTGAKARMLGIGEEKLLGRGVGTCAVCDAAFYKGKTVYVVGGGDAAMEDAMALTKFATSVTLINRTDKIRASKIMQEKVLGELKVPVISNSEVIAVNGQFKLETVTLKNNQTGEETILPADGLFLAIGHTPTTELFKDVLELDEHGYLVTGLTSKAQQSSFELLKESYPTQTSIEGVFGAGDVVDFRYRQAITAAGMGCQAALDVEKYLNSK
ncbi:MAG: thioredoxin-disulfide reductase [Candidatus Buchananbacteria bacterium]|nr:thioredoxin-disulfide reductase [Candidatus Buchananbacteria bacterium]